MIFLTKKPHSNPEAPHAKPLRASKPMTKEQHWRKLLKLHLMVLGHEKPLDAVLHTAICVHSQKDTFRYQLISNLCLLMKTTWENGLGICGISIMHHEEMCMCQSWWAASKRRWLRGLFPVVFLPNLVDLQALLPMLRFATGTDGRTCGHRAFSLHPEVQMKLPLWCHFSSNLASDHAPSRIKFISLWTRELVHIPSLIYVSSQTASMHLV